MDENPINSFFWPSDDFSTGMIGNDADSAAIRTFMMNMVDIENAPTCNILDILDSSPICLKRWLVFRDSINPYPAE